MHPGFFLNIAENLGDNFFYEILPVEKYSDIPLHGRLNTVICSVVRKRNINETEAPLISFNEGVPEITNQHGEPIGKDYNISLEQLQSYIDDSEEKISDSLFYNNPHSDLYIIPNFFYG